MNDYYLCRRNCRLVFLLASLALLLGLGRPVQAQVYYLTTSGNATVTTDADALNRVGYDGSNPTVLAPSVTGSPFLMALDAANQRVFIYESLAANRSIKVVGFNGTLIRTLSVGGQQLTALEYDPINDYLYFLSSDNVAATQSSADALNRIKADGSEAAPQTLIASLTTSPLLLALNIPSNEVYVYEALTASRAIKTVTLSGGTGSVTRTVPVGAQLTAIEYDPSSNYLYYLTTDNSTDLSATDALNRFRPDGSSNSVIAASVTASPLLLALDAGNNRAFIYEGVTANRALKAVQLTTGTVTQITSLAAQCTALDVPTAPLVTTSAATNIAATSATVGGNVVSSALALTERGVVYSSSNTLPTTSDGKLSTGTSTGTFSASLTGLSGGTAYSVRAYATSAAGTSYGNVQSFTTLTTTATPVLVTPADKTYINTAQPTYTGTAPAGSTVTVYVDGSSIGTTSATGGTFALAQPTPLSQSSHTVYTTAQLTGQTVSANSNTNTFTVDTSAPTVSITSSVSNPTTTSPFTVTVTFSEPVTGFTSADVILTNATLVTFSGSGATYSVNLTPTAPGSVVINVAAGAAQDLAGNASTAASPFSVVFALPNQAPTALSLSPSTVGENVPLGTVVGSFTTTDADQPAQSFVYSLVSGAGSTDNASFTIGTSGPNLGKLLTNATLDFETRATYAIRVRTTDSGSPALSFEQAFTVTVTNVNEAPTVATPLAPQSATVGQAFSLVIPASTFSDPETPTALTLSVSSLPAGLSFTAPATISGTPTTATGSPFSLTVTATDAGNLSVSTILTLTIQPQLSGQADLTPMLTLPQANFAPSGPESIKNLTMTLSELAGRATSGVIVLTLTAPLGYSFSFNPAQTSIAVSGGSQVTVNNGDWEVRSSTLLQLTLASKTGQQISPNGVSVIGLSLSRVSASVGTANVTVNVNDDPSQGYDTDPTNNIYVRNINSLN